VTYFVREKVSGTSARSRISATGADIIPKWEYIRTLSADVNELYEIIDEMDNRALGTNERRGDRRKESR
jgi:hypothetical protein